MFIIHSSYFSFHCSSAHRHLHSFPTRRSSDLAVQLAQRALGARRTAQRPVVDRPLSGPLRGAGQGQECRELLRSEEHTSELQSRPHLVCRLLLEKKNNNTRTHTTASNKTTHQP